MSWSDYTSTPNRELARFTAVVALPPAGAQLMTSRGLEGGENGRRVRNGISICKRQTVGTGNMQPFNRGDKPWSRIDMTSVRNFS